jgi:hypothetical protein
MRMLLWIIYIGRFVYCYCFAKIISGFIKPFFRVHIVPYFHFRLQNLLENQYCS